MTASYKQLNDYTENEFIQFVTDIVEANSNSEEEHHALVSKFEELVQHPRGNGLIYYPEDGEDDSPEGIVQTIKTWRKSQGLPLFKDS
ncbi:bacteriocin immunity protein [Escherichia marmotae]|uniref:bacteriocin immunity protein n=1 Tax=Escherichia marmotae TaxID=1499973 RepID=UPI0016A7ACAC|nr:bacteriocin immunity protein [Escherichia marmotae]EFJ2946586.1 bacteriocin immunity protein [Escherichia coli]EHW0579886.1 bacteriocin immunity protein [Escherichia coli]MDF1125506.1 bacteriocin immunity protein [Escherichia coli]MDQ9241552.1 bacteriocin immunity protein [Escherichia marmotae]MED0394908.1 bacteriocin immunity protein [Escherichia coli]